jgi:hypothetical protein
VKKQAQKWEIAKAQKSQKMHMAPAGAHLNDGSQSFSTKERLAVWI